MTPYLLAHQNPHAPLRDNGVRMWAYPTRKVPILAVVVHVTAGLQGRPAGADSSAEKTAAYAASTDRAVSWHSGSDRDSHLQLLPDSYTAFQCVGYNSRTIGHEISKTDVTWADEDPAWVTATLEQAAACLRPRLAALNIPIRHATKDELDRAILRRGMPVGLIGHSALDPARRRDPGADFPWARFLRLLTGQPEPTKPKPPAPRPPSPAPVQEDDMRAQAITADGKAWFAALPDRCWHISDQAELAAMRAAGTLIEPVRTVTPAQLEILVRRSR